MFSPNDQQQLTRLRLTVNHRVALPAEREASNPRYRSASEILYLPNILDIENTIVALACYKQNATRQKIKESYIYGKLAQAPQRPKLDRRLPDPSRP